MEKIIFKSEMSIKANFLFVKKSVSANDPICRRLSFIQVKMFIRTVMNFIDAEKIKKDQEKIFV